MAQILLHEGLRLKPYQDTVGKLTIGVGRNLDDKGISQEEAFHLLENDLIEVEEQLLASLPWVRDLDEIRLRVLMDMGFNLGVGGLLKFKRTLRMIKQGDYAGAAGAMLESKWAKQVGNRAKRLSKMMATGEDYS